MENLECSIKYLSRLESLYGKMVSYPSARSYSGIGWSYSVTECIEQLKQELHLKRNRAAIKRSDSKDYLTSTDLASYNYCPVSYAIQNTFLIEHPNNEDATEVGKRLHEQLLSARTNWHISSSSGSDVSPVERKIFDECKLVFAGHSSDQNIFIKDDWRGIPDYIFEDNAGKFFVVEEKFQMKRDPAKMSHDEWIDDKFGGTGVDVEAQKARREWEEFKGFFYSNHIVQLASYIQNITSYDLSYGYLIYWYYDYNGDQEPYIHKMVLKKVILDSATQALYHNTVSGVKNLVESKKQQFDISKLNMKKCVGCVVSKYCGHKSGKYEELQFPYASSYMQLFQAELPDEKLISTIV
ncbi:MAG: hypothetical protein H7Y13_16040 [Sphingobacteriaceae bacterium]|nr:hypothetical protein [Sphingobacteriaceae bacterium]